VEPHPKRFELVKIWAKSPEIRENVRKFEPKMCQPTFAKLLNVRSFYKNGTQNESEEFFLEIIFFRFFSGKFAEAWAKIFPTPKNLPAPTPMM